MLDLIAFKATDVPAKNAITNGNFSLDTDGDGFADGWFSSGSNAVSPRIENNTQYWMPLVADTVSSSIHIKNREFVAGRVYYIRFTQQNVRKIYLNQIGYLSNNFSTDGVTTITYQATATMSSNISFYSRVANVEASLKYVTMIDLTSVFGAGNEPTDRQMDALIAQFPNTWFDGTKNLFNAKHFMVMYFKKMTELDNAITALGGGA